MFIGRVFFLYVLTAFMIVLAFIGMVILGMYKNTSSTFIANNSADLMDKLPKSYVSGREANEQYLVENVALFSRYPKPKLVSVGYVGTSRSKLLRPELFGLPDNAVVGAGNSYNEITYGLLLQAEILRLRFPNLKRVYFEASMLLRRPDRLVVENDHRKYFPLLDSIRPLCDKLSQESPCHKIFQDLTIQEEKKQESITSVLFKERESFKFSSLFKKDKKINVMNVSLLSDLKSNGERVSIPKYETLENEWKPEIKNDNPKIQRLRSIENDYPWDGLFDMISVWGEVHNIQVVLFQPPVRSDTFQFQKKYGLNLHVSELKKLSQKYNIPFINLDKSGLGYINNWGLFGDEDHLDTCHGSGLLTLALEEGYKKFNNSGELFPKIYRREVQKRYHSNFDVCR